MERKKTIIYITSNKDNKIFVWISEPVKNESSGKWHSKFCFVNSQVYEKSKNLSKDALTWDSEPMVFSIC